VGFRGTVLVLLLLLAGGAGGWAWADATSGPVVSEATPTPVAAADPRLPYTRPEVTRPDPETPPLSTQLSFHDERLGSPKQTGLLVPIPDGWGRTSYADPNTATWRPPDPPLAGGYVVRVTLLDENRTIRQKVATRPIELQSQEGLTDLEVTSTSLDTLKAHFILDGFSRYTVIRWVSLDGDGLVDVEISASGRQIDEAGMEALVVEMAGDVRRAPQKPGADTPSSTE
jgi:hypothetical protein